MDQLNSVNKTSVLDYEMAFKVAKEILPTASAIYTDLENPSADCALRDLERAAALIAAHTAQLRREKDDYKIMLHTCESTIESDKSIKAKLWAEIDTLRQRVADLKSENNGLRLANDKRVTDFLNEKACCSGQDCGCMGVTRLQQLVQEEAGTQLAEARRQGEEARKEIVAALRRMGTPQDALRHAENVGSDGWSHAANLIKVCLCRFSTPSPQSNSEEKP